MLTVKGKHQVLRMLSSQAFILGRSLAVGIGTTAPTETDQNLEFELTRAIITVVSPDYENNLIVFKATLPNDVTGIIREVGLYSLDIDPSAGQYGSRMLFSFDPTTELWPDGTVFEPGNARIGASALRLSPASSATDSATLNGFVLDLLGYSDSDLFRVALNANSNVANVKIRLAQTENDYYELTLIPTSGYQIITKTRNDFTTTGNPSWSSISSATFSATATSGGGATVDLDGIRIQDDDSFNPEYFLVSREVLSTPVTKSDQIPTDVEYAIEMDFE